MLHGYNLGHNFIQGSIILPSSKDMDCIATISDWTEYINPDDEGDYITAYPLIESGFYIVAKTWYADEMKRPGCVWTHSLLIPINVLSQISDFRIFINLFRRPDSNIFDPYSSTLCIDTDSIEGRILFNGKFHIPSLPIIYKGLIEQQEPLIYRIENTSRFYQYFSLLLMNYIPYGFLKQLSFSTGSASVRMLNEKPISLQFTTLNNDFVKSITEEPTTLQPRFSVWQYVSTNIEREEMSLSKLIHTFAEDISDDCKKFKAFITILWLMDRKYSKDEEKNEKFHNIIEILATYYPDKKDGILLKKRMLQQTVTSIFCSEVQFFYELSTNEYYNAFRFDDFGFWIRYVQMAKMKDRHSYLQLLESLSNAPRLNDIGENLLSQSNVYLTPDDLHYIIEDKWELFQSLACVCPLLLNNIIWDTLSDSKFQDLLNILERKEIAAQFEHWKDLLISILKRKISIGNELANTIFKKEDNSVNYILDFKNSSESNNISQSFILLLREMNTSILDWMDSVSELTVSVAYLIIDVIPANSSAVKEKGSKRWRCFEILGYKKMPLRYFAYLYLLSFNWLNDTYALQYMKIAFYPIYKAAKDSQLDYNLWHQVSTYAASLPIWQDWDHCKKLRKTVVRRLKNAGCNKEILINYTPEQDINAQLIKLWEK